jgi:hypothetical protein
MPEFGGPKKLTPRQRIMQSHDRALNTRVKQYGTRTVPKPAAPRPTAASRPKITRAEGRPSGGVYGGMSKNK